MLQCLFQACTDWSPIIDDLKILKEKDTATYCKRDAILAMNRYLQENRSGTDPGQILRISTSQQCSERGSLHCWLNC